VLDFGKDKFELTDNESSVLVRSLSVNPQMQGRGIGKQPC
jgi:N-acetylglutamate synthase-like GNAT family acetyltransferase